MLGSGAVFYRKSCVMPVPMTAAPQLVYLAFGPETYQREAVFSIVSALSHTASAHPEAFGIQVFTDQPGYYAKLPVTVRAIDASWNGPHRYHFRIKHAALRQVLKECEKAVLIDTDTFFRVPPEALFDRVRAGTLLCNAIGSSLGQSDGMPAALLAYLNRHGMHGPALRQTNSGVIGLVASDASILDRSISLMDELRPVIPKLYTLEELSLALVAHDHLQLAECTDAIHHYWSRKAQFRAKIDAWYLKHGDSPLSLGAVEDSRLVNDRLPRPPQPLRAWQKALTVLVASERRQFTRELLYGCHVYPNEFDRACAPVWWDKALTNAQDRLQRPLSAEELSSWLADPILKRLAGRHYSALRGRLLGRLEAQSSQ